jgi:hypothetical protein
MKRSSKNRMAEEELGRQSQKRAEDESRLVGRQRLEENDHGIPRVASIFILAPALC